MTEEIAVKLTLCSIMFMVYTFFMCEAIFSESRIIRITALTLATMLGGFIGIIICSLL